MTPAVHYVESFGPVAWEPDATVPKREAFVGLAWGYWLRVWRVETPEPDCWRAVALHVEHVTPAKVVRARTLGAAKCRARASAARDWIERARARAAARGEPEPRYRLGIATLSPDARRAIAARGGRAVQARGTGRRWTSEQARAAGRLGGKAPHPPRKPS